MLKFFQPWVLVAIGVVMNIGSALIVHTFVERNMSRIDALLQQSSTVDGRIDTLWRNYRKLEQQQEYFTLLLLSANPGAQLDAANTLISQAVQELIQRHDLKLSLETVQVDRLQGIIRPIQQGLLDNIDAIYLEKINIEKQRTQLAERNQRLNSIALFLQLLGLILVLARDLARRN